MDGDGILHEVVVSQESINARLWARRYQYGLSLLGIKKSDASDKVYERWFDANHPGKALESALWQVADANKLDSPSVVQRAIEKAKVFDTFENFAANHYWLVRLIKSAVLLAVVGAMIVQPPAVLVIPIGLVAYILTARFFNLPSVDLALLNLAVYVAIFAILARLHGYF